MSYRGLNKIRLCVSLNVNLVMALTNIKALLADEQGKKRLKTRWDDADAQWWWQHWRIAATDV